MQVAYHAHFSGQEKHKINFFDVLNYFGKNFKWRRTILDDVTKNLCSKIFQGASKVHK